MSDALDELEADELVTLAMLAFIHMKDNTPMTDKELLNDILTWFRMMTVDADMEVVSLENDKELH